MGESELMNPRPNRLHLSFLLLIPVFFMVMTISSDASIEWRTTVLVISMGFTVAWILTLTKGSGNKEEEEEGNDMEEVRRF